MKKFTHIGLLYEKKVVDEYTVLNPISIVKCNIIDDITYDVEFLNTLGSCFESAFDTEEVSLGFVTSIEEIETKYNKKINEAINDYRFEMTNGILIQINDQDDYSTLTYRVDLYNKKMSLVACFKNEKLELKNEKIDLDINKISKNNFLGNKKDSKVLDKTNNNININIKELYNKLKKNVISQDEAIKKIVSTIDRNYSIDNYRNKTNILLIGPSGSGKTEIFRTIEEVLNIPVTIEDSEQYSAVGYEGSSISDMLVKLYFKANGDLSKAEKGILVIDEIDKKVSKDKDNVSGTRVLNSLLALMEGTDFRINISGDSTYPEYIDFNTKYLTVVLAGAFSDILDTNKAIGFNNDINKKKMQYNEIDIDKLENYGLTQELLRRVSIYKLKELSVDDLIKIMKNSKNSALTEYYKYADKKNIKLNINCEAIEEIAKIAYKKQIGASGIKATLNELLNDAFFEIAMKPKTYESIELTKKSINSIPPYILTKRK